MNKTRNVAVLVGSLRKESINRKVANALVEVAPEGLKLGFVDIGQLPLYNQDDDDDPPSEWTALRERISAVDAVLFVTPEYNRSVPAALKNAIDVGSRLLWQERMERQTGCGRQRLAGRYRWIRREPSFAAVFGFSQRSRDGAAGSLPRRR